MLDDSLSKLFGNYTKNFNDFFIIFQEFSDGFELFKNEDVTEGDELHLKCGVSLNTFTDRLEWTWHSAANKTLHLSSAALPKG